MESLKRKPDLSATKEFELKDGTKISVRPITARTMMQAANAKDISDIERGFRIMAAKLLVNGQPIVYDDLMDRFTDVELTFIGEKIGEEGEKKD